MISNDEDLSFFLDEISIFIQHWTPLCVSIVKRTISTIPNDTQDTHIPSFILEIVEDEKIVGDELVPNLPAPLSPSTSVNEDHIVESPYYSPLTLNRVGRHASTRV